MAQQRGGPAEGLVLAEDGRARARICWWSRGASPVPRFAAGELRAYVERMSGVRLEVTEAPAYPAAAALPSSTAGGLLVAATGSTNDAAEVVRQGIDLLGHSDGDAYALLTTGGGALAVCGASPRAVLYGAYDVVQRLGVRFFAPTYPWYEGDAELVPHRSTLALPTVHRVETPSYTYRRKYVEEGWSHSPDRLRDLVDWMAKRRLNVLVYPYDYFGEGVTRWDDARDGILDAIERRGLVVEVGGHGYESFLRPDSCPRFYTTGSEVFDVQDDRAVAAYVDAVVGYLRTRPEIGIFDAWPPDAKPWPAEAARRHGSVPNAHAHVTNRLVEGLADAGLDVTVAALAYAHHLDPPAPTYALHPSVLVDFAPYARSYATPIWDPRSPENDRHHQLMRRWREAHAGPMAVYEYYRKYSWHSLPIVPFELITKEIPFYRSAGMSGFGIYSEPADWMTYELTHHLVADLSWSAGLEPSRWRRTYLSERHGDAADAVDRYLHHVEEAGGALFDRPRGNYSDLAAVTTARDHFLAAHETLTQSMSDGRRNLLLDRLVANAEYAVADTDIAYYDLLGDVGRSAEARRRTAELVTANRYRGTVLQSLSTARRQDQNATRRSSRWMYASYRQQEGSRPQAT